MTAIGSSPSECQKNPSDSCPSGHELNSCISGGLKCRQCSELTFQPNENWLGDRCRFRRVCDQPHMHYKDHGSTTKDADCECNEGFHFENEDQRACVPNRECDKGYGQGEFGTCVNCLAQHMYSDTKDRIHKCKALTNCEKQSRCTLTKSNGTFDNICGPVVRDIKTCDEPQKAASEDSADHRLWFIAGGIIGSLILVMFILIIIFIIRRNNYRRRKYAPKPLSQDQLEELKHKLLKECDKDVALCNKVLSKSVFVVEERIERQIWTLAQELYRSHPRQGKYELIVEKYKDSQHKYAVNGYMQEWKSWRGETKEAVAELFKCLRQCKRDDIIYEICNGLRQDICLEVDLDNSHDTEDPQYKENCYDEFVEIVCPCIQRAEVKDKCKAKAKTKDVTLEKEKGGEDSDKLLEMHSRDGDVDHSPAEATFTSRPSPSAPCLDDAAGNTAVVFVDNSHAGLHRQYSQPVQATS